jgi:sugar (pentulose or hexulose) kinase
MQELHIDISVSSGGLDQFLEVVPLKVDEGGVAVVRLNTSGVVSFLETHADMETAPLIMMQLMASPEHGELRMFGDRNITTVTQQQLDAGEVSS